MILIFYKNGFNKINKYAAFFNIYEYQEKINMQIIRFKSDDNKIYTGCDFENNSASVIEGDIYTEFINTKKRKFVEKILTQIGRASCRERV